MVASLDGIDALVFTAGIGEGSVSVRRDVCRRLRFLGIELDEDANAAVVAGSGADIAAAGTGVRIVVVHAREDVVAARAAAEALGQSH